jgi:hypothetical protein
VAKEERVKHQFCVAEAKTTEPASGETLGAVPFDAA